MKAAIFIDVQNDFITGSLRNEKAIEVTPSIVEFAKNCVENGYKIYATRDTHKPTVYANIHKLDGTVYKDVPWNGYLSTLEGEKLPIEHCIEGTDGWQIDTRLMDVIVGNCTFVNKPTFGSNDLVEIVEEDIRAWDDKNYFDEIIICGFCTSICVLANAVLLRAKFPDIKITVKKDLCADVSEKKHESALEVLNSQQIEVE